ncbi:hypothetical protein ACQ4PT_038049 [Festuca glaucescens]
MAESPPRTTTHIRLRTTHATPQSCRTTLPPISGFQRVATRSEASLTNAVAMQPVAVSIEAGGTNFQHYSNGVYNGPCGTQLNHGVTVVGMGKTRRVEKDIGSSRTRGGEVGRQRIPQNEERISPTSPRGSAAWLSARHSHSYETWSCNDARRWAWFNNTLYKS